LTDWTADRAHTANCLRLRDVMYAQDGFLEHIRGCKEAQELWSAHQDKVKARYGDHEASKGIKIQGARDRGDRII
jgi:hypothetical protein